MLNSKTNFETAVIFIRPGPAWTQSWTVSVELYYTIIIYIVLYSYYYSTGPYFCIIRYL